MTAYLEYKFNLNGTLEEITAIDGVPIAKKDIVPCEHIVDRCDVKYPRLPCWEACGNSYIEANGMISCKNYDMIKRFLGIEIRK